MIASHLTRGREYCDAKEFFEIAKRQTKKDPQVIFSVDWTRTVVSMTRSTLTTVRRLHILLMLASVATWETTVSNAYTIRCVKERKLCVT